MVPREAPPAPQVTHLVTTDFDRLAAAFERWDHRFRQFSTGPFHGALTVLRLGPVQILRVQFNRRVLAQGATPPGCIAFTVVTAQTRGTLYRGQTLRPGQLNVLAPRAEMNHFTGEEYQNLIVIVPATLLLATAHRLGEDVREDLLRTVALSPSPAHCFAFHDYLNGVMHRATSGCYDWGSLPVAQNLRAECLARLVELVAHTGGQEQHELLPSRALRMVLRAEEMMEASLDTPHSTAALCADLEISERTLRGAFQQVRGISPIAAYKMRRLNAVRQDLKTCVGPVHEVAQRWGFWHTGEFAADYQRLFGELPSQTLAYGLRSSSRQ